MAIGALMIGGERGIFCRKMDKVVLFQWVNFYIPLFITYIRESLTCWYLYIFYFSLLLRVSVTPYRSCLAIAPSATSIKPITYSIITTS